MIIGHVREVEKDEVQAQGCEGAAIQWLLGPKQDVPHFHMRYVTVAPGGVIPLHSHGPIHQMFIVKGQGAVLYEGGELTDLDREPVGGFWSVISGDDFTTTEVVRKPGDLGGGRFPFVSAAALTVAPGEYTLVVWVDDALNPASRWVPINTDGQGLFGCPEASD